MHSHWCRDLRPGSAPSEESRVDEDYDEDDVGDAEIAERLAQNAEAADWDTLVDSSPTGMWLCLFRIHVNGHGHCGFFEKYQNGILQS